MKTKVEFNCGLYVDPASGDIYSVPNDTVDTLVVFGRQAEGNVAPDRELSTPHGTYGIAVDETRQEMFLTVQHSNSVVAYRNRDYLTIPQNDIPQIKVLMTVVGGKTVHLLPQLAGEIGMAPVGPVTWPTKPLENRFVFRGRPEP